MLHPAAQQALDPMQRAAARAILSHPAQPTAVPHAAEPPAVNLPSPEAAEGELPAHSKALDSLDDAMPLNFLGNGSLSLTNSLSNLGSMPESLSDLPMPRINSQGYIGNALPVTGTADDLHAHVMTREQHRISNPLSGGGKRLMPTSVDMQALLDLDFGTDGCDAPSSPDAPRWALPVVSGSACQNEAQHRRYAQSCRSIWACAAAAVSEHAVMLLLRHPSQDASAT